MKKKNPSEFRFNPSKNSLEERAHDGTFHAPAHSFTCPIPPSINKAYKNSRFGRSKTREYKTWEVQALTLIKQQKVPPIDGYCILICGFERNSKLADVSNRLKLLEDVIVRAGVIEDDRYITALAISWLPPVRGKENMAHVSLYPIQDLSLELVCGGDPAHASWIKF